MRRAADFLESGSTPPVFLMNVPSTWGSRMSQRLYVSELKRLGEFLCSIGGRHPSDDSLRSVMLRAGMNRSTPMRACKATDGLIPVGIVGGALTMKQMRVFQLVRKLGGVVKLDGTEGGERCMPGRYDRRLMERSPIDAMAKAYLTAIPDIFQRPNTRIRGWLHSAVAARGIKGVIVLRQVWCDKWHAESGTLGEYLSVPVLSLDAEDDLRRQQTRVEAFIESLK